MIAILKYNAGNTRSVENAVHRLGFKTIVTDDMSRLRAAEKVIFPGVGEASSAMAYLRRRGLDTVIPLLQQPVLGICLGMQILCESSEEGNSKGLGIFKVKVKRFPSMGRVPHMGWNNFSSVEGALFDGVKTPADCYYVHSYYAELGDETVAVCNYILPFSAALRKNNFYATQFHPEKSSYAGLCILNNFLNL